MFTYCTSVYIVSDLYSIGHRRRHVIIELLDSSGFCRQEKLDTLVSIGGKVEYSRMLVLEMFEQIKIQFDFLMVDRFCDGWYSPCIGIFKSK